MKEINYISKAIFAKILAQENITVVHKNIPTAMFDIKNRVLSLPIFKDITADMYDLFISHECGHALFTPQVESVKILTDKKISKQYKVCVNIIEDLRIEKNIKKRFPGLCKSFRLGYKDLYNNNFFGTEGNDISKYQFLDRLNLHTKLGYFNIVDIPFKEDEKELLEEAYKVETFEDAIKYADKLYQKYLEENQGKDDSGSDGDEEDSNGDGKKKKKKSKKSTKSSRSSRSNSGSGIGDDFEEDGEESNGDGEDEIVNDGEDGEDCFDSSSNRNGEFNPELGDTYRHEKENLNKYIDKNSNDNVYIDIPNKNNIDFSRIIIDYKVLHDHIEQYYKNENKFDTSYNDFQKFKNENSSIISYLVKEFELKKAADTLKRTQSARTGLIDTNRLHKFKYTDDLFLRKKIVTDGKNHGLVMFIDCSGSMQDYFADTLEQLLNLVLFCKKTNIPFEVYGFTNSHLKFLTKNKNNNYKSSTNGIGISLDGLYLKNYFSSKMNYTEFVRACKNIQCIINSYRNSYCSVPSSECLNGTPLNQCIVCSSIIINKFKEENKLQKVNAVFLTDGASDYLYYNDSNGRSRYVYDKDIVILRDKESRKEYRSIINGNGFCQTAVLFDYVRNHTGANIVGFYIDDFNGYYHTDFINEISRLYPNCIKISNKSNKLDDGIVVENAYGYNELYLIHKKTLEILNKEFIIKKNDSAKTIVKDFSSYFQGKLRNRIILSRFIEQIA